MQTLTYSELQSATTVAKKRLSEIKGEFPSLEAHLVFALKGQQTGIGSSPDSLLKEFPSMAVDDEAAAALRGHLKKAPGNDASQSKKDTWQDTLSQLNPLLKYHGHIPVELRFGNLDYTIIDQLRSHPLVDQKLTPQTRASICITLGTIEQLAAPSSAAS